MADPSSDSKKIEVNADYVTSQLSKAIGAVAREQDEQVKQVGKIKML
jgi:hypothetical protein